MNELENIKKSPIQSKKVALSSIFIALGLVLSFINIFAYFTIFGFKINPYVHLINSMAGVLLGPIYSIFIATSIAILRFSFSIGTIHAFHGGISGALVVSLFALLFKKRAPKLVLYSALLEPLGTVFIGGTIAYFVSPMGSLLSGLMINWGLFALSSVPGSIAGFLILNLLKRSGISYEDFAMK
ncbi:MAG: energy coupling factor transporter S component ThiW [Candidatus Lokiarchaeota archaeon]|nr:energy coupling factor transporter S component ThiW [Candidatus Lokiarchaeota archaeon]